jgi:tartrate dehydratase beta subunit/fumarate hydratase class I family protein
VGKGKRVDVYLEVRKRRGIYFLNETSACGSLMSKSIKN